MYRTGPVDTFHQFLREFAPCCTPRMTELEASVPAQAQQYLSKRTGLSARGGRAHRALTTAADRWLMSVENKIGLEYPVAATWIIARPIFTVVVTYRGSSQRKRG